MALPGLARCTVQQAAEVGPGRRVCRSLFGPVDHAELGRELRVRLLDMEEESRRRWGFDFQRGAPLGGSRYVWEEVGEDTVPVFYRTPRQAPSTPGSPSTSQKGWEPNSTHPAPNDINGSNSTQPALVTINGPNSTQAAPIAISGPNSTRPALIAVSGFNSTQPTPSVINGSSCIHPAPDTINGSSSTQSAPIYNGSSGTQSASDVVNESSITHPAPNVINGFSSTHPAPRVVNGSSSRQSTLDEIYGPKITQSAPTTNRSQGALNASPAPSSAQHAPSGNKRTHAVAHITDFFPVRKKTKPLKALCDNLQSASPS